MAMASSSTAIKQGSKKWVVGTFPESKEFSAVPTNWLIKTTLNGRTTISCKWPPPNVHVTSDLIKAAVDPSPDWPMYKIRLANNGKEYSNFNKAWHEKVLINSESSEEFDTPKTKKHKNLFQSLMEESDSSEDGYYISVPDKKSSPKMTVSTSTNQLAHDMENSFGKSTSYMEICNINENRNITTLHNQSNVEVEQYIPSMMTASTSTNQSFHVMENSFGKPVHTLDIDHHRPENESYPTNFEDLNKKNTQLDKVEHLVKEQHNLQMLLLERLLSKIENMEKYLKNRDGHYSSHHRVILDDEFLVNFPMNDPLKFSIIEKLILNDNNFTEKLEYFIKTVGGVDPKDHIKRTLGKLFQDEYAVKCTWTGRGKDVVTKIGDSATLKKKPW